MNRESDFTPRRFVGIDLHKHFVVIAAVDATQRVLLKPRRITLDDFPAWAEAHLGPKDATVLEATGNAWYLYDLLAPLVGRCVVANPLQVKWIAAAAVKTDPHDALRLAKLLAANLIPEVWVPPHHVRELRALIAHRRALVKQQTSAKNRLHSVLHRQHLVPPSGDLFAAHHRDWWRTLALSSSERLRVLHDLATLDHVQQQLVELGAELHRLSTSTSWNAQVTYLVQLPGFGLLTAMTVLSAIGDITRFPTDKRLVGYAGLGAGVHDSGQIHRDHGITKQGRRDLRRVLVEAAWSAVTTHPYWKAEFERLTRRKHPNQAIVAVARKLLVVVWHVLTEQVADRHADPEKVARYYLSWASQVHAPSQLGIRTATFARQQLDKLGLGRDLTQVKLGWTYKLPPSSLPPRLAGEGDPA
jgi:transposase